MMFETLSIHDRKLWLQNMNDAAEKYRQNVEVEKNKKYSIMPTATNKGILRLVLVSASNLKCPRVSMGADQEQKTPIVSSTCNPKWNSNMQFFIKDPRQDVLCITVFDKDYFSP